MASIAVFCGASEEIDREHISAAEQTGNLIAIRAHTLVYGGGLKGLMGGVFRGASASGGKVIGVIPEGLMDRERGEALQSASAEIKVVGSIDERKREILRLTEIILVLPGGFGSLEELFAVICLREYGYIPHPIGILNHGGIYNQLFSFLAVLGKQGFIPQKVIDSLKIAETPEALFSELGL